MSGCTLPLADDEKKGPNIFCGTREKKRKSKHHRITITLIIVAWLYSVHILMDCVVAVVWQPMHVNGCLSGIFAISTSFYPHSQEKKSDRRVWIRFSLSLVALLFRILWN